MELAWLCRSAIASVDSSAHGDLDANAEAIKIVSGYINNGWLKAFDRHSDLQRFVGGRPILNKFACLSKEK